MGTVYLQGSETVHSAAGIIASAAREMAQTASNFQGSVEYLERVLQSFLEDFRNEIEKTRTGA